jgi:hypothetical protein
MHKIIQLTLIVSALMWASPAGAKCGNTWGGETMPEFAYIDSALRIRFFTGCTASFTAMQGKIIKVTLDGETEPFEVSLSNQINGMEIIQNILPAEGWGNRAQIGLSLDQINPGCYPNTADLNFSILNENAPVADKIKVSLRDIATDVDGLSYVELEVEPSDPKFIYWATVTPSVYKYNDGKMPLMIRKSSPITGLDAPGNSVYLPLMQSNVRMEWPCRNMFTVDSCTDYKVTLEAEDLKGNKSKVSDPISFRLYLPPGNISWSLGDPLNCGGSGCSCSNVGL